MSSLATCSGRGDYSTQSASSQRSVPLYWSFLHSCQVSLILRLTRPAAFCSISSGVPRKTFFRSSAAVPCRQGVKLVTSPVVLAMLLKNLWVAKVSSTGVSSSRLKVSTTEIDGILVSLSSLGVQNPKIFWAPVMMQTPVSTCKGPRRRVSASLSPCRSSAVTSDAAATMPLLTSASVSSTSVELTVIVVKSCMISSACRPCTTVVDSTPPSAQSPG